ncbi:hypothetical protein LWI29_011079 [Acer saccharum]|uniref:Non-haem dioxygenase N-terminal domain-containing protein n=1 Tax=Acer saccharum TaxID=4024 RepID=A0AA39RRE8_ACESA|nr:hypothetical protein LWI29_011079 [Acer saccharum]
MQRLLPQDFMDSELQKLDHACREWGFFQLINHEVSSRLVEKVKIEIEEFFKLPLEEKNKFGPKEGDVEEYVNSFVVSEDKNLNWGDRFFFTTSPPHLRKPHIFPNLPPSFRKKISNKKRRRKDYAVGLFVFPVQPRVIGVKYSYQWMALAQQNNWHVLLDARVLGPKDMDSLGLSLFRLDFIITSFYRVFGYDPTGFECLLIKKSVMGSL